MRRILKALAFAFKGFGWNVGVAEVFERVFADYTEDERTAIKQRFATEQAIAGETNLTGRLASALKRLNPWLSETNVAKAVKTVTHVAAASLAEANEKVYTSLTYGIALEQDLGDGRKSHTVRFFDFDRPDRNEWIITRQYKVLVACTRSCFTTPPGFEISTPFAFSDTTGFG